MKDKAYWMAVVVAAILGLIWAVGEPVLNR